ncbi:hypothetical protein EV356DRAFT_517472 [Viridothelium virens]|uniref:Uncharacterized protein n=1 Tax=Viridothelium virens TaxID=1048519 RepID=A0A6A6H2P1_VIRVR|nr:hypothetical protein EV356DRAFT_517472 [Viridothelium virens]
MIAMMKVSRIWSGRKGWSYPILHIIDFPQHDLDHWYEVVLSPSQKGCSRATKIAQILQNILSSMAHFLKNLDDANEARKIKTCDRKALEDRLLPLLSRIIGQYTRLFREFCQWIDSRSLNNNSHTIATSEFFSLSKKIHDKIATWKEFHELRYEANRWICRTPQEIVILIIRLTFPNPEAQNDGQPPSTDENESLKKFISELKEGDWNSRICEPEYRKNEIPGAVPAVVCLDETWQRIGASRPSWPKETYNLLPWGKFFTKSRDFNTLKIANTHLRPAAEKLTALKLRDFDKSPQERLPPGDWRQLQSTFRRECPDEVRHFESHVWQAINADWSYKDQCGRCRCYYSVVLAKENDFDTTSIDTEAKRLGSCAETCLYAEHIEYQAVRKKAERRRRRRLRKRRARGKTRGKRKKQGGKVKKKREKGKTKRGKG